MAAIMSLSASSNLKAAFVGKAVSQTAPTRAVFPRKMVIVNTSKKSSASIADVAQFQRKGADTGSTEVQIALLTSRVVNLTAHLKVHKKDYSTQRGLLQVLGQRKRLLDYLFKTNSTKYAEVVSTLGIRDKRAL
uniref:30S ribosomal protein S15 n=1 Tax=Pyramimonas obovata TaxID=1411642 RepID=A0A7S0QTC9_9CHLO|eukprot:CAMPEP_0118932246 /NCGR_PEP_ID=MMETSP1169-20130426/9593_1 /TAXON_ID=36882 /ORGANISM="Pyramimonas obovata, Strain CCMP722" /LENGTH=133 /DNA_ID=CAMNT_0006874873 /DNA_START=42 /DNA_END=443 /DNA_ORIENTATION=+